MQRQAVSIEPDVIPFHCSLTLWGKLALPGGRLGLVRRFVPSPGFLPLLHSKPGLLAGPQVIDKQIMETNKACLLSPHGDVALCCYSRPDRPLHVHQQSV